MNLLSSREPDPGEVLIVSRDEPGYLYCLSGIAEGVCSIIHAAPRTELKGQCLPP